MSHWAEIDSDNKVIRVLVGDNNDPAGDEGYQWLIDNLGGTWIKTSYNNKIRKNFAGPGMSYNSTRDAFIAPKPYESWILDEEVCQWKAPIARPQNGNYYDWDEETISWKEQDVQESSVEAVLPPYPSDGNVYKFNVENNSWDLLLQLK
jgi:hypothetical protein